MVTCECTGSGPLETEDTLTPPLPGTALLASGAFLVATLRFFGRGLPATLAAL